MGREFNDSTEKKKGKGRGRLGRFRWLGRILKQMGRELRFERLGRNV
jgi:hypothetical protein